jgi:T-complex protein 1 subunit alpha
MSGYRLALKESVNFITKECSVKTDTLGEDAILNAAKTSMSSKLLSAESEFFAKMVVEAMKNVKMTNAQG